MTESIQALILPNDALSETVAVIRQIHPEQIHPEKSVQEHLREGMVQVSLGTAFLRTACAARDLTMVAADPALSGSYHNLPAAYFDRPSSETVFQHGILDLTGMEKEDPLRGLLLSKLGWTCGFRESDFFGWLKDPEIGPTAGPRMRLFFDASSVTAHDSSDNSAEGQSSAESAVSFKTGCANPCVMMPSGIRTNREEAAERAAGEWIAAQVQEWRNGRENRPIKDTAYESAKNVVSRDGPLSRKAFERAWVANVPLEWKQAGRPKGRKTQKSPPLNQIPFTIPKNRGP